MKANAELIMSYLNTWLYKRKNGVLYYKETKIVKRGSYISKGGYIFGTKLLRIPSQPLTNAQARKLADAVALNLSLDSQ